VDASATRTILESASLNERDAAYAAVIQSLAKNFDDALTAEVRRSMGPVLR
jgi:membrane-bound ClpP family serine protease